MNSQANSVSPGDWISIYGTGMSQTYLGGAAAPTTPLDTMSTVPAIWFDLQALPCNPDWAGLAPGYTGLDQINVQVPPAVREGCAVPVQASYQDDNGTLAVTQPLTVAIRQGGGPCADPPAQSYGLITWQKTVSTTEPYAVSETDIMTASLQSSPGQRAPASPSYSDGCPPPSNVCNASLQTSQTIFGPACGVPGCRSLAAGTVTVQGPGLSATPAPQVPFLGGNWAVFPPTRLRSLAARFRPANTLRRPAAVPTSAAFRQPLKSAPILKSRRLWPALTCSSLAAPRVRP